MSKEKMVGIYKEKQELIEALSDSIEHPRYVGLNLGSMASTSSTDHQETGKVQILERRLTIEDEEEEAAADHEVVEVIEDEEKEAAAAADNLAASLMEKLEVEYRLLSPTCCIFKVPHNLRVVNEKVFIPQAVSIGPIHHKKLERYEGMGKYKLHYLKQFLRRRPSITLKACMKDCVRMLKSHEKTARECYADDITLTSDEFVEMMMLDGCFIVELFLRSRNQLELGLHSEYDPLFDHRYLLNMIFEDLLLLENQLPFFVLKALFNFINNACQLPNLWEISFLELALEFVGYNEEDASTLQEPSHLLDLKYKTGILSERINEGDEDEGFSYLKIPTATQLWEAGVKFRATPLGTCLLNIKFENGTLEIPTIEVDHNTEQLFRNLIAYEQCHIRRPYMANYFIVMDDLINSPGDVALLNRKGIIINNLGGDEEVSNLVNKMLKNATFENKNFQYKNLYEKVNQYYQTPWHKQKAKLKHDYFNSPWSFIAFLAASAILICTFIQAVNSFKS
ncbi:hypothetical protein Sjap_019197 [Stephania japonica]|uniref:Uncharacterized protein n=1 Tax=Stephania japonica TaxID=461633 RepID=A0AAP0F3L5_9MAGN